MHDEDSAMPIMGDGSAGRPAGVECACVRAWPGRRSACCAGWGSRRRIWSCGRVTHAACAAASWTLSSFSEYVVGAQFLDPRITGAIIQTDACDGSRTNARSAIARSTDRPHCICMPLPDDGPDKCRVPFYLSARQSVFVSIQDSMYCEKKLFSSCFRTGYQERYEELAEESDVL